LNNKIFSYLSSRWTGLKFNYKFSLNNNIINSENSEFGQLNNDYNESDRSLSLITTLPRSFDEGFGRSMNNNYKFENLSSDYNEEMNKSNSSSPFGIWVTDKSNNRIQKYIPLN
jgi:hypothetical protein